MRRRKDGTSRDVDFLRFPLPDDVQDVGVSMVDVIGLRRRRDGIFHGSEPLGGLCAAEAVPGELGNAASRMRALVALESGDMRAVCGMFAASLRCIPR